MKRREALEAACALIGEELPILVHRRDSSWSHCIGILVDGLPCVQVECHAIGESRDRERVILQVRAAGTADEEAPFFLDPPGQPEPVLDEPLLVRWDTQDYRWSAEPDQLRPRVRAAIEQRWKTWHAEASAIFDRDPDAWAEACARVAAWSRPGEWWARCGTDDLGPLTGLTLPIRYDSEASHWTSAWLGFGPILDRLVTAPRPVLSRIDAAAAIVRAKLGRITYGPRGAGI